MARFVLSTAGRPTALLLAGGALACLILGFGSVSLLPRPSLHANKHPPGAEHHAGAISESTQSEGFAAQVHAVDELHLARLKEGTSIWCQGDTVDSRRCRFANLCYNTAEDDFVAIHGRGSTWSGLPDNRFGPSLLSMSSVLNHNVQYMGFVDITGAALEEYPLYVVSRHVHLFKRFKPDNIMHVLHDDLLPLFHTLNEVGLSSGGLVPDHPPQLLTTDIWGSRVENELYRVLTGEPLAYMDQLPKDAIVCFRHVTAGQRKESTWYQYGFDRPQSPLPQRVATGGMVRQFTRHVQRYLGLEPPAASKAGSRRRRGIVVFSRTRNRLILNEATLVDRLRETYNTTVTIVRMENHTFAEQVDILRSTGMAIGLHGSLLIMGMFLPVNAVLVELFPFAVPSENYTPYRTMAQLPGLGLRYVAWENKWEYNSVPYPNRDPGLGGINHLPLAERSRIAASETVPPHKCCTDPTWLYRIYQDTTVDLDDLFMRVQDATAGLDFLSPHVPTDGPSLHDDVPMLPSQALEGVCVRAVVTSKSGSRAVSLGVSWRRPWNAEWVGDITFEVWVQEIARAYKTTDTHIVITGDSLLEDQPYTVWVRGITAHVGQFGSPIPCRESGAK